MARLLRRVAAECLAAGITAHFRWLPSGFSWTAGISRLWEKGGAFAGCKAPRRLPGHALWRFFERGSQVDAQIPGVPSLDDLVDDALLCGSGEAAPIGDELVSEALPAVRLLKGIGDVDRSCATARHGGGGSSQEIGRGGGAPLSRCSSFATCEAGRSSEISGARAVVHSPASADSEGGQGKDV